MPAIDLSSIAVFKFLNQDRGNTTGCQMIDIRARQSEINLVVCRPACHYWRRMRCRDALGATLGAASDACSALCTLDNSCCLAPAPLKMKVCKGTVLESEGAYGRRKEAGERAHRGRANKFAGGHHEVSALGQDSELQPL